MSLDTDGEHDLRALQVAWAGGLFEGEGCFTADRGGKRVRLQATLASTDEDVVRRFHEIVGVGRVERLKPRQIHHKPQWRWKAEGRDTEAVFALLEPWLYYRRRERFAGLLRERRTYEDAKPEILRASRSRGVRTRKQRRDAAGD